MKNRVLSCPKCGHTATLPPKAQLHLSYLQNCPQCAQLALLQQIAGNSNNSQPNSPGSYTESNGPGFLKGLLSLIALISIVFITIFVWDITVKAWTWVMEYIWYILGVIAIIAVSLSTKSGQEGLKRGYEKSRNGESFTDKN